MITLSDVGVIRLSYRGWEKQLALLIRTDLSSSELRHLIWNGYHEEAHDELFGMRHMASEVAYLNGDKFRPAVARLLWNCDDLRRYLANNAGSLIDYGERYRSKLPISTSRAEGCVDEIANARMAKKQRMRWSPQGAHRISVVRAAVLDGRLKTRTDLPLAA